LLRPFDGLMPPCLPAFVAVRVDTFLPQLRRGTSLLVNLRRTGSGALAYVCFTEP